jgi:hypothetical protein
MVWNGIQVHDVMQQAGFCAVGRGKFSWEDLTFGPLYPGNQPTKDLYQCFSAITIDLDTSNG